MTHTYRLWLLITHAVIHGAQDISVILAEFPGKNAGKTLSNGILSFLSDCSRIVVADECSRGRIPQVISMFGGIVIYGEPVQQPWLYIAAPNTSFVLGTPAFSKFVTPYNGFAL